MGERPRWAKANSQQVADEYLRLGWRLASVFRVGEYGEPSEWLFEWVSPGPAVPPDRSPPQSRQLDITPAGPGPPGGNHGSE